MDRDRTKALKKALGENIRAARTQQGVTQEQLAKLLDMSTEVYGRMERGLIFPRVERFIDICETLGVSADRLLGLTRSESSRPVAAPVPAPDELSPVTNRFRPLMKKLSATQRVAVRRHMVDLQRLIVTCLDLEPEPEPESPSPRRKQSPRQASSSRPDRGAAGEK